MIPRIKILIRFLCTTSNVKLITSIVVIFGLFFLFLYSLLIFNKITEERFNTIIVLPLITIFIHNITLIICVGKYERIKHGWYFGKQILWFNIIKISLNYIKQKTSCSVLENMFDRVYITRYKLLIIGHDIYALCALLLSWIIVQSRRQQICIHYSITYIFCIFLPILQYSFVRKFNSLKNKSKRFI
jgi:hypothetical protein